MISNLEVGMVYTNQCDGQQLTYTIKAIEGANVVVYSSNLDRSYTLNQVIFEDTMRALGFSLTLPNPTIPSVTIANPVITNPSSPSPDDSILRYKIFYVNHLYHSDSEFEFINQAIQFGKETGMEFRVELGDMICCAWDAITGLRFYSEYQAWKRDQEVALSRMEGSIE